MSFVVVYDANVLYSSVLRDLLIRIAQSGLVQAKWTVEILDETFDAIKRQRPDLDEDRLLRTRKLMCGAVRDALVTNYEPLIPVLDLPDPDDRHVLAAAIKSGAQTIVTDNLRDFPPEALGPWNVEARSPDDFVVDQIHLAPAIVHNAVQQMADAWKPAGTRTVAEVLAATENRGLVEATALLRVGRA